MSRNSKADARNIGPGDKRRRAAAVGHHDTTADGNRQAISAMLEVAELTERLHGEAFDLYAARPGWDHEKQARALWHWRRGCEAHALRCRLERLAFGAGDDLPRSTIPPAARLYSGHSLAVGDD